MQRRRARVSAIIVDDFGAKEKGPCLAQSLHDDTVHERHTAIDRRYVTTK